MPAHPPAQSNTIHMEFTEYLVDHKETWLVKEAEHGINIFEKLDTEGPSGYWDINVSGPFVTAGVIFTGTGVHFYGGAGLCTPGFSVTTSGDKVTPGWNSALQASLPVIPSNNKFGIGGQVGRSEYTGEYYIEHGAVSPQFSLTTFYVTEKLKWWWIN